MDTGISIFTGAILSYFRHILFNFDRSTFLQVEDSN